MRIIISDKVFKGITANGMNTSIGCSLKVFRSLHAPRVRTECGHEEQFHTDAKQMMLRKKYVMDALADCIETRDISHVHATSAQLHNEHTPSFHRLPLLRQQTRGTPLHIEKTRQLDLF